jgi:hypothetical protein
VSDETEVTPDAAPPAQPAPPSGAGDKAVPPKRSRKAKLIEFALWAALSIVIAVIMIALSNKLLPNNF